MEALDEEASSALVAADDAVRRSATEAGFAERQLGLEMVAPFWETLDRARAELTAAFALRQRLDDADAEADDDAEARTGTEADTDVDDERRVMLRRILEHCESVDATIDARTEQIERLRDLEVTAPERLAELRDRALAVLGAVPTAESTYAGLVRTFDGPRLAEARDNPSQARAIAMEAVAIAERGHAAVESDPAAAVHAAHDAEDALGRAQALLDVATVLSVDLRDAPGRIDAAIASLTDGLADVARLGVGDSSVAAAETQARAALTEAAGERTSGDPFGVLDRLSAAETALDGLLEPRRGQGRLLRRADHRLDTMLPELSRELAYVSAMVAGNRPAVGSTARTRFSEAQRQADLASSARATDPVAALGAAQVASRMVAAARRRSQSDIRAHRPRGASTSAAVSSRDVGPRSGWGGSGRPAVRSGGRRGDRGGPEGSLTAIPDNEDVTIKSR